MYCDAIQVRCLPGGMCKMAHPLLHLPQPDRTVAWLKMYFRKDLKVSTSVITLYHMYEYGMNHPICHFLVTTFAHSVMTDTNLAKQRSPVPAILIHCSTKWNFSRRPFKCFEEAKLSMYVSLRAHGLLKARASLLLHENEAK